MVTTVAVGAARRYRLVGYQAPPLRLWPFGPVVCDPWHMRRPPP